MRRTDASLDGLCHAFLFFLIIATLVLASLLHLLLSHSAKGLFGSCLCSCASSRCIGRRRHRRAGGASRHSSIQRLGLHILGPLADARSTVWLLTHLHSRRCSIRTSSSHGLIHARAMLTLVSVARIRRNCCWRHRWPTSRGRRVPRLLVITSDW